MNDSLTEVASQKIYTIEVWMKNPISGEIYSLGEKKIEGQLNEAKKRKNIWLYLYRERTVRIVLKEYGNETRVIEEWNKDEVECSI